ncbi:MAG: tetratricopeptide repeat protein [Dysgonamonadaceae bacterium]|jgi:tetratricopeptide (TPR) repeat protein|nr:tetratricopeptide repeat protein [Dysgonamonadaceae bacterium]
MKKLFFILITIICAAVEVPAQDLLQSANDAYAKGDYAKAVEFYEAALKENGQSAAVYYNLGNSYYKANKIAPSILNYERALLLEPGNGDIRFNLEIAKLKTVDKIEPIGEFFLTSWFRSVEDSMSTDAWSKFAIVCFIFLIVSLFLFFFSRKIGIKKVGFYAGICLLVLTILGNIFAYNQKKSLTQRDSAIIFVPTTTIKSSPADSGTDLFILHEGAKVKLKSKIGNWNEIETADGNIGWIKSEEIAVI